MWAKLLFKSQYKIFDLQFISSTTENAMLRYICLRILCKFIKNSFWTAFHAYWTLFLDSPIGTQWMPRWLLRWLLLKRCKCYNDSSQQLFDKGSIFTSYNFFNRTITQHTIAFPKIRKHSNTETISCIFLLYRHRYIYVRWDGDRGKQNKIPSSFLVSYVYFIGNSTNCW